MSDTSHDPRASDKASNAAADLDANNPLGPCRICGQRIRPPR